MKTDKFEKTIRQKLESISPDFQESDWAKMQNYMHVHTPPTLWQQYGSWLGYAAAASVTTVMAFMYVNQLSQNNKLSSDVRSLQKQIAIIKESPVQSPKVDTIYILRDGVLSSTDELSLNSQTTAADEPKTESSSEIQENTSESNVESTVKEFERSGFAKGNKSQSGENQYRTQDNHKANVISGELSDISRRTNSELPFKNDLNPNEAITSVNSGSVRTKDDVSVDKNTSVSAPPNENYGLTTNVAASSGASQNTAVNTKALGSVFDGIVVKTPNVVDYAGNKMNGMLLNRLSAKQIRKSWLASTANNYKNIPSDKKTEQPTQAENVIPKLNIKVPYRFGGGLEWQKGAQIKTVTGEVLVAKKFSISAGLSWLKAKPMEFFTKEIYREKNKRDFPNEAPKIFQVTNIRVEPTLVQIPLTVAFRNEMKDNFAYFVGAGANVTVKSNEKISYNCLITNPRPGILTESIDRKMDISPINSINFSFGLEKTWHPIVVQAEGNIYRYIKPLNPWTPISGPGFKVKLLYQIGRKR